MDEAINEFEPLWKRFAKFQSNFKKCSKANKTKGYLEGRMEGLNKLWDSICKVDETIQSLKTEENASEGYFEDDQFGVIEENYYQLKGEIGDQLAAFNPQPQSNPNANANRNNPGGQQNDQSTVKLPKITLPTFEGSYHTWLSFKNRFMNLIHNSTSLSNVEKLEYLKSCVKDEAEKEINRFQITDQNYTAAWDRLNEKYDNKRILQDTHIETIIDRKEIRYETAKELRELLDVIQESLEALKNMEVDTTSWDPMMVVLVKRKLPFKTREEWEKELNPTDVPTFAQLSAFLEKRYRTVESLELVGGGETETGSYNQTVSNKGKSNQSLTQRANCLACNNLSHSLMRCETFVNMTLSNRSAFVNAKKLCRNCLAIGHVIKDCKSSKRCFKCNRSHHTLLHKEDYNQSPSQEPSYTGHSPFNRSQSNPNNYNPSYNPNSRNQSGNFFTNHQQSSSAQAHQTQNQNNQQNGTNQPRSAFTTSVQRSLQAQINSRYSDESKNQALFPTAMVTVKDEEGKIWYLRALLDQCSEEVFIKESTVKKLKLKQVPIPVFDVSGVNEIVTAQVNKATQFVMVINKDESMKINANVVETLVGILPREEVKLPENLFKNLKLADPTFAKPEKIDIMFGSKIYAQLLLNGVLKEGGYLAQNTKLGWIISGKGDEIVQPNAASFCGLTKVMSESRRNLKSWLEKPRQYYAPKRKSHPVYLSNRNQPLLLYSNLPKQSEAHPSDRTNSKSAKENELKLHQNQSNQCNLAVKNAPNIDSPKLVLKNSRRKRQSTEEFKSKLKGSK